MVIGIPQKRLWVFQRLLGIPKLLFGIPTNRIIFRGVPKRLRSIPNKFICVPRGLMRFLRVSRQSKRLLGIPKMSLVISKRVLGTPSMHLGSPKGFLLFRKAS